MPYDPGYLLLDKYRIEKLLGQGAFGEVYLVTHLQLNVLRVVKVLRRDAPGMDSDIYYGPPQARFKLEAQLGARLNSPHPNPRLLQIFNLHADERLSVLEMEYAAGGSLAQRIEKNRAGNQLMPVDEALRIAAEVAEGLAALHKLDIVHRDVKPANILFDEEGHAHLGDLGLAQVPGGDSRRSQLSTPALHPGTAAYMSPEQANSGAYLASAADIYSLGATLFEVLTGRIYSGQRPGTRAASLRSDLPAPVDELLAKMLSESARERPWDGAEAATLLKAVLADLAGATRRIATEQAQEQARELARLQAVRKAQSEARAREQARLEAEDRARWQAEHKKMVKKIPPPAWSVPSQAGQGVLERYWPGIALAVTIVLIMLAGGLFALRPSAAFPTPLVVLAATPLPSPTVAPAATPLPSPTPKLDIGSTWLRPADGMTMLYVPGATFTMGSDSASVDQAFAECQKTDSNCDKSWFTAEEPAHSVTLSAYWIDQTDVTNAEYAKCVAAGGCTEPSSKSSYTRSSYYGNSQFDNYPVIYVNWAQAKTYCEWVGQVSNVTVGLPSEAQWELAARGTNGRTYPWAGSNIDKTYANYGGNIGDTTAVCSYPQGNSPSGACDMAGNVWQWVADWYDRTYYGQSPVNNPTGPVNGTRRVLRSGSWISNNSAVRSVFRNYGGSSDTDYGSGFRCARSQ